MKFNISMQDDLFERMEEFCKRKHMSRSGLLSQSVQQYMDAVEQIPSIQVQIDELKDALSRIEQLQ